MNTGTDLQKQVQNTALQLGGNEAARTIQEVQGAIVVAQHCPRSETRAFQEIVKSCKRPSLAEKAVYAYPRGGQQITGPSIRLAEVIARLWGNVQYGIREISQNDNETRYEAYCWDVQTNVRASRVFTQKHERHTKKGVQKLKDPRDIYEIVASNAARRLRACILEIVPSDIVEEAISTCDMTLKNANSTPLTDRVRKMVASFTDFGVTEEMIEKRIGHKAEAINEVELINLGKIYMSIKDGFSNREDWFEFVKDNASNLNSMLDGNKESKTKKTKKEQQ
jgi:hypothetical protein